MTYPCGKIYKDIEQGSEEWFALKLGKVSASKIADVMSRGKGSAEPAGVRNYRAAIVCERLTGQREETYTNGAMARGTELEPMARECYEFLTGATVEQVAFVDHPTIKLAGCSPDGILDGGGLIEIKCPNTATHIEYLLGKVPPTQYIPQMQFQMACTGATYCQFVSYDPRLPEDLQLFVAKLDRDDAYITQMENAIIAFQESVESMLISLRAIRG